MSRRDLQPLGAHGYEEEAIAEGPYTGLPAPHVHLHRSVVDPAVCGANPAAWHGGIALSTCRGFTDCPACLERFTVEDWLMRMDNALTWMRQGAP